LRENDSFFKEVMNVEYDHSRLEDFLCTVLKKQVKIGYMFPGARCACYSSDLLLRQLKSPAELHYDTA